MFEEPDDGGSWLAGQLNEASRPKQKKAQPRAEDGKFAPKVGEHAEVRTTMSPYEGLS
jgi:hypothetical protein